MSIPSNKNELLSQLKEKTKENINNLTQKGLIYKEGEFQKNYIQNNEIQYSNNSLKNPIPTNIIYHSLYDPETKCQLSNGKLNFILHTFSINKDYDIKYDKNSLDNQSLPKFYKMSFKESVKLFIESNNSIIEYIKDLKNYPKIFEFQYNYQHPIPNPTFMGPKLLNYIDSYKIIFISPLCLIIDIKKTSNGFRGIDCFYCAIRHKFDMEMSNDLVLQKTIYNVYFGVNFIRTSWIKGKIESSAMEEALNGFSGVYLPLITKELNYTIKKYYDEPPLKKILIKEKMANSIDTSMNDDLIINDSFLSGIDDDFNDKNKNIINNKFQNENQKFKNDNNYSNEPQNDNIKSKDMLFNNIIYFVIIIGIILIKKLLGKEYLIIVLLSLVVYYLFLINNKLDKLCLSKNI